MSNPNLKPPQDEVTLRELRDEIRELHAMLRATLQDVETVRRDVGDARSLAKIACEDLTQLSLRIAEVPARVHQLLKQSR